VLILRRRLACPGHGTSPELGSLSRRIAGKARLGSLPHRSRRRWIWVLGRWRESEMGSHGGSHAFGVHPIFSPFFKVGPCTSRPQANRTPTILSQVVVFIHGTRMIQLLMHAYVQIKLVRREGRERNNILSLWVGSSAVDCFMSDNFMACF